MIQKAFRASVVLLCMSLSAIAQTNGAGGASSPQAGPSATATQNADHTLKLDVIVTDKANKLVPGLQQDAFTVLENKRPAKVLSFAQETGTTLTPDSTTEVILVFDEVNTVFSRISFAHDEVSRFLLQNGGKLPFPVSLVFVADTTTQQTNVSRDGNALAKVLAQHKTVIREGSQNGSSIAEDRVQHSLKAIDALAANLVEKPGRKMMIWISPGWPVMDGHRVSLSGAQAKAMFNAILYTTTALRLGRITLYSVDPMGLDNSDVNRRAFYLDFLKGVHDPDEAQLGNMSLQVFAVQSGGQALYGYNSIQEAVSHCIADLDSFYTFTVQGAPADKLNEYHSIEIKLVDKSLKARYPTGYYAQR